MGMFMRQLCSIKSTFGNELIKVKQFYPSSILVEVICDFSSSHLNCCNFVFATVRCSSLVTAPRRGPEALNWLLFTH